jgi:hypothetical protein
MMRRILLLAAILVAACTPPKAPEATPKQTAPAPLKPELSAAPPPVPRSATAAAKPAPPAAKPAPGPSPVKAAPAPAPATAPAMDLTVLEQRLKSTDAIGVMTKLSLKNQVDDLVARFKAFHAGTRPPTLAELRPAFELLVMKVLSLLQDKDPALARDIHASRESLWAVLADREKLSRIS